MTRELAAEGANVVAGARTLESLHGLDRVTPVTVDLARSDGPSQLIGEAVSLHG